MGILATLVIPLPALAVDALLTMTLAASLTVLLVALRIKDPLDISIFPSLLLLITLLRLALNISTTRLILMHGSEGEGAAGHVVEAFGRFAVAGSVLIGAVVFTILLIVNFAVITKGSGRISEVAARFTLDALPGKQMSIDADLAAGVIDDVQAKARRKRLEQETEFFGAMDGASKFVRGDAVAGLAITVVNIVGGLLAGVLRDGLDLAKAAETYTILTIGDGLVSQVPALLISTAAGLVVTRAGTSGDLAEAFRGQMVRDPVVLLGAAAVIAFLSFVPGMPTVVMLAVAAGLFALARMARRARPAAEEKDAAPTKADKKGEEKPGELLALDILELQLGTHLVPLIDASRNGELPGRITSLRRRLATELGVLLPAVHLRDDLGLAPESYRLMLRGCEVARGTAWSDRVMVLDPRGGEPAVDGIPVKEPAFGLPARWVATEQRAEADLQGLTVVDAPSAITTHIGEVLRRSAAELVGRQEVQELLALLAKDAPKLVEDVVPNVVTAGDLLSVLRGLLREGVSVRDLRTVLEALAEAAPKSKDPTYLCEQARRRLARQIAARVCNDRGVARAITLDRQTEQVLRSSLAAADGEPMLALDVDSARKLIDRLETLAGRLLTGGSPVVVLAPPDLRRALFDFASRFIPDLWVVSARELPPTTTIESAGILQLTAAAA